MKLPPSSSQRRKWSKVDRAAERQQEQESYPTSSSNPSINWPSVSGSRTAIFLPRRSTEIVRICEILTQEGLGIIPVGRAKVKGNPAFCGWLVIAIAITVSDFRLNNSWLRIRTGRNPACSRPRTGFKSAQQTSPLSIRAKRGHPNLVQPTASLPVDLALPVPEQGGSVSHAR